MTSLSALSIMISLFSLIYYFALIEKLDGASIDALISILRAILQANLQCAIWRRVTSTNKIGHQSTLIPQLADEVVLWE